jgi:hypothetical protein
MYLQQFPAVLYKSRRRRFLYRFSSIKERYIQYPAVMASSGERVASLARMVFDLLKIPAACGLRA